MGFKKRVDVLDVSFNDHSAAFKSKTTWEVMRALLVFNLCSVSFLVDNCEKVSIAIFIFYVIVSLILGVSFRIYVRMLAPH
jgi:hypothetical protein